MNTALVWHSSSSENESLLTLFLSLREVMFCHHPPTWNDRVLCFHKLRVRTGIGSRASGFEYGLQAHNLNTFSFLITFVIKIILQWHFSSLSQNHRAVCPTEF